MNEEQKTPTGIKDFIAHTSNIGNIIIGAASTKNSVEPLPFTDYSKFNEKISKRFFFLLNYCVIYSRLNLTFIVYFCIFASSM
jgi:hypothetical protein